MSNTEGSASIMADDKTQAPEPLTPEEATKDSEAVKTEDERYVGVDPIYKQSAYEEPLEVQPEGRSKEAKAAVEGELDVLNRVKANEAGCVVQVEEPVPFEEWVAASGDQVRKARTPGVNTEAHEEDMAATEAAKVDGKMVPSSGSGSQPGVNRVS